MARSELSRERQNIKKIIKRGEQRGTYFNIPFDLNALTLSELQDLHRNIYQYAQKVDPRTGNVWTGEDVKKYENKARTGHARGVETYDIDYEVPLDEISEIEDSESEKEKTPHYDFNSDDYSEDNDTGDFNDFFDERENEFSEDVMSEDDTVDNIISDIREIAESYSGRASDALINAIDVAVHELGYAQVAENVRDARDDLLEYASQVASYYEKTGRGAMETRIRNFENFLAVLYKDSPENFKARAHDISQSDTFSMNEIKNVRPPKNAAIFSSISEGKNAGYRRFWYESGDGNYAYYDYRGGNK